MISTQDFPASSGYDISRLRKNKNMPLSPAKPAKAFNGSRVIFFLNKLNFIIETIEK
ncbi:hypothetical protein N8861_04850 [Porticoccus sp.]|nr:hypothetical protein [Porticoccus sp.]